MFFATAGQQATHRGAGAGGVSVGGGFPPIAAIGRGAPPGFATRGAGECFLARGEGAGAGGGGFAIFAEEPLRESFCRS